MVFSEIESACSLLDRLRRLFGRRREKMPESVASRFIRLFENHGVHRNQIPRYFGHGLTLSKIKDDENILDTLTEEILDDACKHFAVRREWLDGVEKQIYPLHDFYKEPNKFIEFIEALNNQEKNYLSGVLITAKSTAHEFDALIVLEERIGELGEKTIYRYHLSNNWIFKYWKARAYLTACIACAWERDVFIMGRKVPIDLIRRYTDGTEFLEYGHESALPTKGEHWYPEDMAVKPEVFLDGINEGSFGKSAGLRLWLDLDKQGYMTTKLPYDQVRGKFESELANISGQ